MYPFIKYNHFSVGKYIFLSVCINILEIPKHYLLLSACGRRLALQHRPIWQIKKYKNLVSDLQCYFNFNLLNIVLLGALIRCNL